LGYKGATYSKSEPHEGVEKQFIHDASQGVRLCEQWRRLGAHFGAEFGERRIPYGIVRQSTARIEEGDM
jgi:hypothetical protein